MAIIKAVECDGKDCGKLMKSDGRDFFTISGNLMIGLDGGLIGNNLEDGKVKSNSYFCSLCFMKIIKEATGSTTIRTTIDPTKANMKMAEEAIGHFADDEDKPITPRMATAVEGSRKEKARGTVS